MDESCSLCVLSRKSGAMRSGSRSDGVDDGSIELRNDESAEYIRLDVLGQSRIGAGEEVRIVVKVASSRRG